MTPRTWTAPGLDATGRDQLRQILEGEYWGLPWGEMCTANVRKATKVEPKKTEAPSLFRSKP